MDANSDTVSPLRGSTTRGLLLLAGSAARRPAIGKPGCYFFYRYICGRNESGEDADHEGADESVIGGLPAPYSWTIWRPRILPSLPAGLSGLRVKLKFLFRWALHRLHLFAGPGCGALLIYDRERLVHYSGFTEGYWRFPCVAAGDFQIGDTWTDPAYRGRGLALFALRTAMARLARPGRGLWYIVEAINQPSIRVAERAGFTLTAQGERVTPWGLKLAGAYVIRESV
jgi:RimJ/RimL family protein N-acetyltransferase